MPMMKAPITAPGIEPIPPNTAATKAFRPGMGLIRQIQADLEEKGLIFEVIGSTGQKKIEAHPMASQLPKYNDTANKTLGVMLDIIQRLGTPAPAGDKLGEFLSE